MAQKPDSCANCVFAHWETTKSGRRKWTQPGRCTYKIPPFAVPKAMMGDIRIPKESAGIWLDSPHTDCLCFQAEPTKEKP